MHVAAITVKRIQVGLYLNIRDSVSGQLHYSKVAFPDDFLELVKSDLSSLLWYTVGHVCVCVCVCVCVRVCACACVYVCVEDTVT